MRVCLYITNIIGASYSKAHCRGRQQPSGNKKSGFVRALLESAFDKVLLISPAFIRGKGIGYIPATELDGVIYPPSFLGNMVSLLWYTVSLYRLARREKRDGNEVILCVYNYYFFTHLPALIVSKLLGLRLIQEVEDLSQFSRAVHPLIRLYAGLFETRRKSREPFIVCSSYMRSYLKLECEPFVFQGFYSGSAALGRSAGTHARSGDGTLRVLYSGSIDEKRNVFQLANSVCASRPELFKRVRLVITGQICRDIDASGAKALPAGVEYRGYVDESDLRSLSASADAFLHYQILDDYYYCSFPSKVLEYLKYGKVIFTPYHEDLNRLREGGAPIRFFESADQLATMLDEDSGSDPSAFQLPSDEEQCAAFRDYLSTTGVI